MTDKNSVKWQHRVTRALLLFDLFDKWNESQCQENYFIVSLWIIISYCFFLPFYRKK